MELRLYDTFTREKRPFLPIDEKNVRMYVCGPTVYDFAHIGNARPVIVFDVLFRLLRHVYGADHVTYVRNITDVDDKINARAAQDFPGLPLNEAIRRVTEVTAKQFYADAAALGTLEPTVQPRATDFVLPRADGKADMVTLIQQLIARGHAYQAAGEVLFDVHSMPEYGALSGRKLDEQLAGARVAVDAHKRNPADFVLWKQSSENEPGWDSPWGRGRPGWHIECSAMSAAYLGDVFDIHGGGLDLIFPHHENEIAQSRCAHGTHAMANYWMHNGFLQVEGEKMSKSLGNFVTIRDLLDDWPGEVVRYQMLMTHYRQPIDWMVTVSREAQVIVDRWYGFLKSVGTRGIVFSEEVDLDLVGLLSEDLNTHAALARLGILFEEAKKDDRFVSRFVSSARLLGLLQQDPESYFAFYKEVGGMLPKSSPLIARELVTVREAARNAKDFEKSDYLRNIIYLYGYRVVDLPNGGSNILSAEQDFGAVSSATRAKLSAAARVASGAAHLSQERGPSFKLGFFSKFGQVFNYTDEFVSALGEAYSALERDVGVGTISEQDLSEALIGVVLSNRADLAKFGSDAIAAATLFKLFSGVIKQYEAFYNNMIIDVPSQIDWRIGNVAILDRSRLREVVANLSSDFQNLFSSEEEADTVFSIRLQSSPSTLADRSRTLLRGFVTASRFLVDAVLAADTFSPPVGAVERGIEQDTASAMRLAAAADQSFVFPGFKPSFTYRISPGFVEKALSHPLYVELSSILSLEDFKPISKKLLALDRLARARTAKDAFARLLWNFEAIEMVYASEDAASIEFADAVNRRLLDFGVDGKGAKALTQQLRKLHRLRREPGVVSNSQATTAQALAEQLVKVALLGSANEDAR